MKILVYNDVYVSTSVRKKSTHPTVSKLTLTMRHEARQASLGRRLNSQLLLYRCPSSLSSKGHRKQGREWLWWPWFVNDKKDKKKRVRWGVGEGYWYWTSRTRDLGNTDVFLQISKNSQLWQNEIARLSTIAVWCPGTDHSDVQLLRVPRLVAIDLFSYWSVCLCCSSFHCFPHELPLERERTPP